MFIGSQLISLATFPGVIVHELAREVACKLTKTPVYDVCYFRVDDPPGFVIHEDAQNLYKKMFIGMSPFLFSSLLGILLTFPVSLRIVVLDNGSVLDYLLFWVGFSVLMHACPRLGDPQKMMRNMESQHGYWPSKLLYNPITDLIIKGVFRLMAWVNVIYSLILAVFIPTELVRWFV